jgi:hypothetical protein
MQNGDADLFSLYTQVPTAAGQSIPTNLHLSRREANVLSDIVWNLAGNQEFMAWRFEIRSHWRSTLPAVAVLVMSQLSHLVGSWRLTP